MSEYQRVEWGVRKRRKGGKKIKEYESIKTRLSSQKTNNCEKLILKT